MKINNCLRGMKLTLKVLAVVFLCDIQELIVQLTLAWQMIVEFSGLTVEFCRLTVKLGTLWTCCTWQLRAVPFLIVAQGGRICKTSGANTGCILLRHGQIYDHL